MKNTTKVYRMKLSTYRRIRWNFKAKYGETTAEYFERLAEHLGRSWYNSLIKTSNN